MWSQLVPARDAPTEHVPKVQDAQVGRKQAKGEKVRYIAPAEDRFWSKVRKVEGSCWIWLGAKTGEGYGVLSIKGKLVRVHRYSYSTFRGPIPSGLTIDHLCRNRLCVNPSHLEPVTNWENILRGTSWAAKNIDKTHCIRGHLFDSSNTALRPNGHRTCRACEKLLHQRYRRQAKIAQALKLIGGK